MSTPPYKRLKFTASSGNRCELKVFAPHRGKLVVDASWDDTPSQSDMEECDRWFPAAAAGLYPGRMAELVSTQIENPEVREAVISNFLRPDPRNN